MHRFFERHPPDAVDPRQVVLDYDSAGNLVGIDIDNASADNASANVQMDTLTLRKLPGTVETIAG